MRLSEFIPHQKVYLHVFTIDLKNRKEQNARLFRPPLRKGDSAHGKAHSCKQTMSLLIRISDSLRFPEMEIQEVFEALLISLLMSVNPFSSIHFCKYFFASAATQLREISAQVMFCTMFNP